MTGYVAKGVERDGVTVRTVVGPVASSKLATQCWAITLASTESSSTEICRQLSSRLSWTLGSVGKDRQIDVTNTASESLRASLLRTVRRPCKHSYWSFAGSPEKRDEIYSQVGSIRTTNYRTVTRDLHNDTVESLLLIKTERFERSPLKTF